MDNKEKNSGFSKLPNKPYFVWLLIICAVVFLVSLPRGLGGTQVQELDIRKLMGAAENDSLVSISIRNDPAAGKDWYVIDGKIKNPMFGKEGADAKAPAHAAVFFQRQSNRRHVQKTFRPRFAVGY